MMRSYLKSSRVEMLANYFRSDSLQGVRLLVVEDNEDERELLRVFLVQRGAEVETAASAETALTALERFAPDAILSDIGLPGESGYSLLRRCRGLASEHFRRMPAVAVTALSSKRDFADSLDAGFDAHLVKPVELAEVTATILRLVTKPEQSA